MLLTFAPSAPIKMSAPAPSVQLCTSTKTQLLGGNRKLTVFDSCTICELIQKGAGIPIGAHIDPPKVKEKTR